MSSNLGDDDLCYTVTQLVGGKYDRLSTGEDDTLHFEFGRVPYFSRILLAQGVISSSYRVDYTNKRRKIPTHTVVLR